MLHKESRLEGILEAALVMVPTLLGASDTVGSQDNEPTPARRFNGNRKAVFPCGQLVFVQIIKSQQTLAL